MALHRVLAPMSDQFAAPREALVLTSKRRRLLSHARGRVLEIGGSAGRNLPHYPPVELVVALAPQASRRGALLGRLASAPVRVEVHEAVVEDVLFEDGWFDTVVSTLALCSVPDVDSALASARRLLKDDGRLLFLEHVRSTGIHGIAQRGASVVLPRVGGCRVDRDVLGAIERAGFAVESCERSRPLAAGVLGGAWAAGVAVPRRADDEPMPAPAPAAQAQDERVSPTR